MNDPSSAAWKSSLRREIGQFEYLGGRYIEQAFSKYYQHKISRAQLADFLGVKPRSIVGMEAKLMGERA